MKLVILMKKLLKKRSLYLDLVMDYLVKVFDGTSDIWPV